MFAGVIKPSSHSFLVSVFVVGGGPRFIHYLVESGPFQVAVEFVFRSKRR